MAGFGDYGNSAAPVKPMKNYIASVRLCPCGALAGDRGFGLEITLTSESEMHVREKAALLLCSFERLAFQVEAFSVREVPSRIGVRVNFPTQLALWSWPV